MNDTQAFTFYRNYYEIIKYLPPKEKMQLYDAILEYMFEDKEPQLKELLNGIWVNIKRPLDNNKKNIENGKKGGRPREPKEEPKQNPNKTQTKPKQEPNNKANNISYFLFLISNNNYKYIILNNNIYNIIYEWLEYKEQRKEKYTEIGLQKLLTQIENKIDEYGEKEIISLINECMSCNYKGIIFDKLKNKKETSVPKWFDKNNEINETTKEEKNELEYILNEIGG